ncbi:MAG TPA: hypothetical protein VM432_01320 [Bdellovibrionales bacterium]|jgi:hypothetical protein|nr:hypothetical protein [Bdellovibrionales bacterium]
MKQVKQVFYILIAAIVLVGALYTVVNYYGYIFSQRVSGEILEVERLNQGAALVAPGSIAPEALFSFAVAIKADTGEIFTASTQDRQWAVAKKGMCVEALFYPYPFWELDRAGTWNNARLIKLRDCPAK